MPDVVAWRSENGRRKRGATLLLEEDPLPWSRRRPNSSISLLVTHIPGVTPTY
jgi:hypothetical protein